MFIDEGFVQIPTIAAASVASPPAGSVKLFFDSTNYNRLSQKDYLGAVIDLAVGGSSSSITVSTTAPTSPVNGQEWVDLNTGIKYTWVNDGDSSAWVELGITGNSTLSISRSIIQTAADVTAGGAAYVDYVYFVSGTSSITLPTAIGNMNQYVVKNVGVGVVTVVTTSSQTIDGSTTAVISVQNTALTLVSNGSNWLII